MPSSDIAPNTYTAASSSHTLIDSSSFKPVPPPLSLFLPSSSQIPSDDLMTARCAKFPSIDSPIRYQPYLAALDTSRPYRHPHRVFHQKLIPASAGPISSPSSTSSASSTTPIWESNSAPHPLDSSHHHPQSSPVSPITPASSIAPFFSPPSSTSSNRPGGPLNLTALTKFDPIQVNNSSPTQADHHFAAFYSVNSAHHQAPYPHHLSFNPAIHDINSTNGLDLQFPSTPTAFTPSGGSPPLLSSMNMTHEPMDPLFRRHTMSAYLSPGSIDLSMMSHVDVEDSIMKEEKRRRNKESSQRFRDRTRERQREKQERLDYLERRIKDLESQLKQARASRSGLSPDSSLAASENDSASPLAALQRLQQENEKLKEALKCAEKEISRLQPTSTSAPCSNSSLPARLQLGSFSVGQVYHSLPQLSPKTSSSAGACQPSGSFSQSSSPLNETSPFFGRSCASASSPESDSASSAQNSLQMSIHSSEMAYPLTSNDTPRHRFVQQQVIQGVPEMWDQDHIHQQRQLQFQQLQHQTQQQQTQQPSVSPAQAQEIRDNLVMWASIGHSNVAI